jgi:hypothetical protein
MAATDLMPGQLDRARTFGLEGSSQSAVKELARRLLTTSSGKTEIGPFFSSVNALQDVGVSTRQNNS